MSNPFCSLEGDIINLLINIALDIDFLNLDFNSVDLLSYNSSLKISLKLFLVLGKTSSLYSLL